MRGFWPSAAFGAFIMGLLIVSGYIPAGSAGLWLRLALFLTAVVAHTGLLVWRDRALHRSQEGGIR